MHFYLDYDIMFDVWETETGINSIVNKALNTDFLSTNYTLLYSGLIAEQILLNNTFRRTPFHKHHSLF